MALPSTKSEWQQVLGGIYLRSPTQAIEHFRDLSERTDFASEFEDVLPILLRLLEESANPDQALIQFSRFVQGAPDRRQVLQFLAQTPRAVEVLVRLSVASQFLAEILIANPDYLARLTRHQQLAELKGREEFLAEVLADARKARDDTGQWDALRHYQRWQLLRIGACDAFGLIDLRSTTVQLSLLADSLVQACLILAGQQSDRTYEGLAVLALGKLGGEELNYSSDIDLLFVAESNPQDCWQVCQRLIQGLNRQTGAGFLYRVDMRLRPWGKSGPLVSSLEGHLDYLRDHAELWEKQSLLKARVIAGNFAIGKKFIESLPEYLFHTSPELLQQDVRRSKEKIEAHLDNKHGLKGDDVKSGVGSIRDVEFVVQYLQLRHGGECPSIRTFNTLEALVRLAEADLIQADEYRILTDGYIFLRKVEHALQLLHNKPAHELPTEPQELEYLARRLDFLTVEAFHRHREQHSIRVREVYQRYLYPVPRIDPAITPPITPVQRHLARMDNSYSQVFSPQEVVHHAELVQQLNSNNLVILESTAISREEWMITIIAYDYHGELSLICGLLLEYGFNILSGQVFTYHDQEGAEAEDAQRKIVDVFHVCRADGIAISPSEMKETWGRYRNDLQEYLHGLQQGNWHLTQGDLAKRVASAIEQSAVLEDPLYPVEMSVDNTLSERYTVFTIRARDTMGFLYELAHAFALSEISIGCVELRTVDGIANDTLFVTDQSGKKITDPAILHELKTTIVLIKHFTHLLPHCPNPASALVHFREFLAQLLSRPDWPNEVASLEQSDVLDALARLLGVSDFLWNDFLRMQHAYLFPVVKDVATHSSRISKDELAERLRSEMLPFQGKAQRLAVLEAFRDREMFRVDMRHILGRIPEFGDFSRELTEVAEVVFEASWNLCLEEVSIRYGRPCAGNIACPLSLCALGKFGGHELGFASDLELMLVYGDAGMTSGPEVISNHEFCLKVIERLSQNLKTRREGIFNIDWRLRPYGRGGDLPVAFEAFERYFAQDGQAWPYERQALVKLRPIAGDQDFGQRIEKTRDDLLYRDKPFDLRAMLGMRERQLRQLVTAGTINAKFSPGGLVDVEYYIQGMQISHGRQFPSLRTTNTWAALNALESTGCLPTDEVTGLREAYRFWRRLIDALRMVRGDARDLTVPSYGTEDFRFLSRRVGHSRSQTLQDEIVKYLELVQRLTSQRT